MMTGTLDTHERKTRPGRWLPFTLTALTLTLALGLALAAPAGGRAAAQAQPRIEIESGPLLEGAALKNRAGTLVDGILVRDRLDPALWKDGPDGKLDADVRNSLLAMARVFIKGMNLGDAVVKDIVFAGSLTGYLYHPRSDLDIHVSVDAGALGINPKFLHEFLSKKSKAWGEGRKLRVRGRDVQMFMLDASVTGEGSKGIYSLLEDRWISKPERPARPIDRARILARTIELIRQFQGAVTAYEKDPGGTDCTVFLAFTKVLKKERSKGFKTEGEYSEANLVYKALRNGRYTRAGEIMNARCVEARLNLP